MNKEKILLKALNEFTEFKSVKQAFNENQLKAIYRAMEMVHNYEYIDMPPAPPEMDWYDTDGNLIKKSD